MNVHADLNLDLPLFSFFSSARRSRSTEVQMSWDQPQCRPQSQQCHLLEGLRRLHSRAVSHIIPQRNCSTPSSHSLVWETVDFRPSSLLAFSILILRYAHRSYLHLRKWQCMMTIISIDSIWQTQLRTFVSHELVPRTWPCKSESFKVLLSEKGTVLGNRKRHVWLPRSCLAGLCLRKSIEYEEAVEVSTVRTQLPPMTCKLIYVTKASHSAMARAGYTVWWNVCDGWRRWGAGSKENKQRGRSWHRVHVCWWYCRRAWRSCIRRPRRIQTSFLHSNILNRQNWVLDLPKLRAYLRESSHCVFGMTSMHVLMPHRGWVKQVATSLHKGTRLVIKHKSLNIIETVKHQSLDFWSVSSVCYDANRTTLPEKARSVVLTLQMVWRITYGNKVLGEHQ